MTSSSTLPQQFVHNAAYGILICKPCGYAIQKSALKSHLLKHKIYREDQKQLLLLLAQLNLLDPDDVEPPVARSSPVEHLPVFSGLKCQLSSCGHLCVSMKRMQQHWREDHPHDQCAEPDVVAVTLQTFFRGTKNRYFEVETQTSSDKIVQGLEPVSFVSSDKNITSVSVDPERNDEIGVELPIINLEVLGCFHHFITATCFTLASTARDLECWQKEIVPDSLRMPWLMFGLLAISTHHFNIDSTDATARRSHWTQLINYAQEFQEGWISYQKQIHAIDPYIIQSGTRVACLLRCCHWNCRLWNMPSAMSVGQHLELILRNIEGCLDGPPRTSNIEGVVITNIEASLIPFDEQQITSPSNSLVNILDRLDSLPHWLTMILGKPKDIQDVHSVLRAIALLGDCVSGCISRRLDWVGLVQWLRTNHGLFNKLSSDQNVGALIVLAHWSMVLEHFEHLKQQCWFYKGMSRTVRQLIREALPQSPEVQGLI